jgi:hypothetical protein
MNPIKHLSIMLFCIFFPNTHAEDSSIEIKSLLDCILIAHGGTRLQEMKTFREEYRVSASVIGIGLYSIGVRTILDLPGSRSRFEIINNGVLENIVQTNALKTTSWSKFGGVKDKINQLEKKQPSFSPPFKSGVIGLALLAKTGGEKLKLVSKMQLDGLVGDAVINVEKQTETIFLISKKNILIAEKTITTNEKKENSAFTLLYNRYKSINGITVPVAAEVHSDQIPGFATASLEVISTEFDTKINEQDFNLP